MKRKKIIKTKIKKLKINSEFRVIAKIDLYKKPWFNKSFETFLKKESQMKDLEERLFPNYPELFEINKNETKLCSWLHNFGDEDNYFYLLPAFTLSGAIMVPYSTRGDNRTEGYYICLPEERTLKSFYDELRNTDFFRRCYERDISDFVLKEKEDEEDEEDEDEYNGRSPLRPFGWKRKKRKAPRLGEYDNWENEERLNQIKLAVGKLGRKSPNPTIPKPGSIRRQIKFNRKKK